MQYVAVIESLHDAVSATPALARILAITPFAAQVVAGNDILRQRASTQPKNRYAALQRCSVLIVIGLPRAAPYAAVPSARLLAVAVYVVPPA